MLVYRFCFSVQEYFGRNERDISDVLLPSIFPLLRSILKKEEKRFPSVPALFALPPFPFFEIEPLASKLHDLHCDGTVRNLYNVLKAKNKNTNFSNNQN